MSARTLAALAVADFSERTWRPAYLVTLAVAVVLGYLALPPASSRYVVMNAGSCRGVYNSAWAGTVTALAGTLWLMGGGFYVVRSAIARDQRTGVGQILAATPLRNTGYLAGKFASNLMVLASMAGVLAVTALAMQLARGESTAINPGALLLPLCCGHCRIAQPDRLRQRPRMGMAHASFPQLLVCSLANTSPLHRPASRCSCSAY